MMVTWKRTKGISQIANRKSQIANRKAKIKKTISDKRLAISEAGFTLLEVMIALAIIATALVVLLHSYGLGVSMADESKNTSLAAMLAQEKMSEIEMAGFPEVGESEGDFGERHPNFYWAQSISETPIEDLRRVRLAISWDERSMELISYIAKRQ